MTCTDDALSESLVMRARKPEPAPALFLQLECRRPLSGPFLRGLTGIERVRIGRGSRTAVRRLAPLLELEVGDGWMSVEDAELIHADGRWSVRDLGSKNGTFLGGSWIVRWVSRYGIDAETYRRD